MFNVNPSRMWRNKKKGRKKYHPRHSRLSKIRKVIGNLRISLRKPKLKTKTHGASQKRRAKARMKNKLWGIGK